jgi:hypothetical protein
MSQGLYTPVAVGFLTSHAVQGFEGPSSLIVMSFISIIHVMGYIFPNVMKIFEPSHAHFRWCFCRSKNDMAFNIWHG